MSPFREQSLRRPRGKEGRRLEPRLRGKLVSPLSSMFSPCSQGSAVGRWKELALRTDPGSKPASVIDPLHELCKSLPFRLLF